MNASQTPRQERAHASAAGWDTSPTRQVLAPQLLIVIAKLRVQMAVLSFMALDQLLIQQTEQSAKAKTSLRSHARCVLIGVFLRAFSTGVSSCIACGPGEHAGEEGIGFQTLTPTGSLSATIPDVGADP